jgi:hypothetical protein
VCAAAYAAHTISKSIGKSRRCSMSTRKSRKKNCFGIDCAEYQRDNIVYHGKRYTLQHLPHPLVCLGRTAND